MSNSGKSIQNASAVSAAMAGSGVDGLKALDDHLKHEELKIPPPPEKVKEWWVMDAKGSGGE